ncbi:lanC-like protein GCR2 [Daucus carota subsp. sativus]|uniref:lanC-like protein GCR2 n=1 Tax=Daucus carota subsp. sativus TaxID=79200 RepID=UPI0007EFF0D2|nr:PREDICTED: lanC-like protein GCR2 [Daucus carota subsp. sativus]
MAERYFDNEMPNFTPENAAVAASEQDSLAKLLSLPYNTLADKFKTAALHLKQLVVKETWSPSMRVRDYTLYTGALGTAFLLFKAYQVAKNPDDLRISSDIIRACDSPSTASSGRVTFLCGQAGVYALGAVVAMHSGDEQLLCHYLSRFREIVLPTDLPDELLYGRSGFLWACSFIYKNTGHEAITASQMRAVVNHIINSGRLSKGRCPLMYEWHGKKYWGAAHGLAGIMHVLMDMELSADQKESVRGTLQYMMKNRFRSGNYPSSEGNESDRLVHWCHGAPGVALTLVRAAKFFGDEEFKQAAMDAGDVVWNRGLLKRVGICHGISGNAYVFLSLYQLTGDVQYLYKAKAFACFLLDRAQKLISEGIMHGGDRPYSLFEGIGGMAYLFLDMIEPSSAGFPAYQL